MNKVRQFRSSRWWSNITALRCDANLTETELSKLLGKSESYINTGIRTGSTPNVADACTIADLFGVTVEELAFGAIGLQIRQKQLEAELEKIKDEIADAQKDLRGES